LNDALDAVYTGCDCHSALPDLLDNTDELDQALIDLINMIWKLKGMPADLTDKEMIMLIADQLWSGVKEGYGNDLTTIDFTTPDWNMLASLQKDVWHFSAAKDYNHLRELSNALIGSDGNIRTFSEFKKAASLINDKYVKSQLSAEYNLAIAGSQMAGKWVDIERDQDIFPLLEFDAVLDGRTTELCRSLNGTILPVNHPFWKTYYPPNHFNCRSTVRKLRSGTVTNDIPSADIPKMFQTNLAQEGLIFPKGHAYYVDLPDKVNQKGLAAFRTRLSETAKQRLIDKKIDVKNFGTVEFNSKGIKEMINQPHKDYIYKNQLATVADVLLKNSTLVGSETVNTAKAKAFHYLKVRGLNDNFIVVKEMNDGRKIMWSIVDKIK
jgi:SPP1 gp7 family putative phage head morphogenesis protein